MAKNLAFGSFWPYHGSIRNLYLIGVAAAALFIAIIAAGTTLRQGDCLDFSESKLTVGEQTLSISIADQSIERTRGLAGCSTVPNKKGLYFPYNTPSDVQYWMKGMVIPIDIIWIRDGVVIGIDDHVPPPASNALDEELIRYKPPGPVTAVLEVKAGGAGEYGIKEGSEVSF